MEGPEDCNSPSPSPSSITNLSPDIIQPRHGNEEMDLRTLLQALPTRADLQTRVDMELFVSRVEEDMEALVTRVEEAHRRDLDAVRGDLKTLSDKLKNYE